MTVRELMRELGRFKPDAEVIHGCLVHEEPDARKYETVDLVKRATSKGAALFVIGRYDGTVDPEDTCLLL